MSLEQKNNKELIKRRFAAHLDQYNKQSIVQQEISTLLLQMIDNNINKSKISGNALEIGAGTGFLTSKILENYSHLTWTINDLVEQTDKFLIPIINASKSTNASLLFCDAENSTLPSNLSLVVSSSAIQWFDSIKKFLNIINTNIIDGGYFAFSTFGKDNFHQVKESAKIDAINYHEITEILEWSKEAGFEVVDYLEYKKDIYFDSPHNVLRYIKETGLNGNSKETWTRNRYNQFCDNYKTHFTENGSVKLTFNPILILLKNKE